MHSKQYVWGNVGGGNRWWRLQCAGPEREHVGEPQGGEGHYQRHARTRRPPVLSSITRTLTFLVLEQLNQIVACMRYLC